MLYLKLDRASKRSISKQIYIELREKILSGELLVGEPLPSTRDMSKELSIARNTVLSAYEMLVSEGVILSVPGSGFYVSREFSYKTARIRINEDSIASLSDHIVSKDIINFDSGIPALNLFPGKKWNHAVSSAFFEAPSSVLGYDDPQGRPEFRRILCNYLKKVRGIRCKPDQIIVTTGAKQGLSLAAKCLLNAKSEVWIENPTNDNVRKIFSYHTDKIVGIDVDEKGIRPEVFQEHRTPTLIFTTPSHQFPMGGILPIDRRLELIQFARKTGCYLLEDDYDSEFTYHGLPTHSLFEFDTEHVIYVGTFSKVMFPSLRLGYMVVPESLVPQIRELKRLSDHHSNSIYQLALMRLIENGDLERHIRRMKKEYKRRRDYLLELLDTYFLGKVRVHGGDAGMHVVAEFDQIVFTPELISRLYQAGLYIVPVEKHALTEGVHQNEIILGYAQLDEEEMRRGIEILKEELYRGSLICVTP